MRYKKPKSILENLPTKTEAMRSLFENWIPNLVGTELVRLQDANERILAKDIYSKNTFPVYRSASMDGIAVCYDALKTANTTLWIRDQDYCMADTGDDFPEPFDTVIRIEVVRFLDNGGLEIDMDMVGPIERGQCIGLSGSRLKKDELLIKAGAQLTPLQINLLGMGGYVSVPVMRKPRVIYIPTGSELTSIGVIPKRNKNIESNGIMVKQLAEKWGADIVCYPICEDIQSDLSQILDEAIAEGDIVLINGGSSKGSEDFNSSMIENQADFFQHHVRCAPGFPVGIGLIENTPVINIPGPPTATFTVMQWCVRPLIYKANNIDPPIRHTTQARITSELQGSDYMEFYDYAYIEERDGELWITPFDKKMRAAYTMGNCNAFIVLQPNTTYKVGDFIEAEWIE